MKKIALALVAILCMLCTAFATELELTLSADSGFYAAPFALEMKANSKKATIYYTLDGSVPDENSLVYAGALTLKDSSTRPDVLMRITGINSAEDYIPKQDFPTAHVVRAVAITPKGEKSNVVSATYFVGYDRKALYGDTAVVCLVTDKDNLFNYETGIYVLGQVFDQWAPQQSEPFEDWQAVANFTQRGDAWERPVSVTFLPVDGEGFTQDMGMRIKGGASRGYHQKSIRLIAREQYGDKNVNYAIYPDNVREEDGGVVDKYKSFTLRSGGNDSIFGKIRDPFTANVATGLRFETAQNMPVIAFINGEYWGVYTLNEEYTDKYIQYHYGIDDNNVVMIKNGELDEGEEADFALFEEMYEFIAWEAMEDPEIYAQACEMLDMGSFADYWAVQLFIANEDGPVDNNNWQMWRARERDVSTHAYGDTKWRMMLFDGDYTAGIYSSGDNANWDNVGPTLTTTDLSGDYNPTWMLQNLLLSEEFKQLFIQACCDVANVYFTPSRTADILKEMTDQYLPYVPDSLRRFGPQWVTWDAKNHVKNNMKAIEKFYKTRASNFLSMVQDAFELDNPVVVNIKIKGRDKGEVFINGRSVEVVNNAQLRLFAGVPLTITAVPEQGASFKGWSTSHKTAILEDASALTTQVTFERMFSLTATFE